MNQTEHQKATANFYKYQVLYFKFLAIWHQPLQTRGNQLRCWLIFLNLFVMLGFFTKRFLGNIGDLRIVISVFFMFGTEISVLIKMLYIKLKSRNNARLIFLLHSPNFRPACPVEIKLFRSTELIARKVRDLYCILCFVSVHFMISTQYFVDNSALPLSMYEPCDIRIPLCYYGMYLFQYIALTMSCYVNIAFDSLCVALLLFLRAQLDMLASRLENLGETVTALDNQQISQQLRNCNEYYGHILYLKFLIEDFIKFPGSVQIFCSLLVLICNFYGMAITSDDTASLIKTAIYQLAMLQQIFLICYAANEVTLKNASLSQALYNSKWQTWNKSNRRICLMMMQRFDFPLHVRTIDPTYSFNLAAFASIVNGSYSYFALLKRVNN